MSIFWILGAGASLDSGLPIYRGPQGIYQDLKNINDPAVLDALIEKIQQGAPGETYKYIQDISPEGSFILTQNIDGYALSTGLDVVEMHLRGHLCRKNVVLLGENLPTEHVTRVYTLIKERRPKYTIVLGTSFQFPYLRTFITKAKAKGSQVIHINPDLNYTGNLRYRYTYTSSSVKGVYKNEKMIYTEAVEGIEQFRETFMNGSIDE